VSAYLISKNHLDLLLTGGFELSSWYGPLSWLDREPTEE
jgi:hypothetical protein